MTYTHLKRTRLEVSRLSMGTMTFGAQTDAAESKRIMDYALEHGVNVFDTADVYNAGESESVVGSWLATKARDKIILASKVFNKVGQGDGYNDSGLSRRHIINALDASLKRLRTDYLDIYYLHQPDYDTNLEETFDTMTRLVHVGKIRSVGVSNFAAWQIADILALCEKNNFVAPVITQNVYNAVTRGIEAELIPCVRAHNLNLTVYNPLAASLLSGKHKPGKPTENTRFTLNKIYADRYWLDANFAAVESLTKIAAAAGMPLIELAMRWVLSQKDVDTALVGVSKLSHAEQNLVFADSSPLDADLLAQCDNVYHTLTGRPFAYMR